MTKEETKIIKEKLKLKLIVWIAELITEWEIRTEKDKGTLKMSDRSDLIIDLTHKIDKFYKKEIIEKLEYVLEEDNWAKDGTTLHDRILKIIKDESK